MQKRLTRAEVPAKLTWDLKDLYASPTEWETALGKVEKDLPTVTQYEGRLGEGAAVLLACLTAFESLFLQLIHVGTYASLRSSEDGTDPANQGASSRVGGLMAKAAAATSFIRSELLALPDGTIEAYLKTEPGLATLARYLEDVLEAKPHTLSAETEVALASLSEILSAPYMIYNRAKSSDMEFPSITDEAGVEIPMSFAMWEDHFEDADGTTMRRKAWAAFTKGLIPYKNTFAATFATEVKKNVVMARLRKYPSTEEMLLHPQQVSLDLYHNQLEVIQEELAPHFQRYAKLRKRVLGLDKMFYADIKAPLDPTFNPSITYEAASDLILEALAVMGPEYLEIMQSALTKRWCDLSDNVGKSTGAFCSSPYGVHPYIMITWKDNYRGVFVLAHELGHAGHFGLAMKYQRLLNNRPSTYFVEAPSTMNELLLGQHILAKSNDVRMRRWVLTQFLGTYHHNFVTHLLEGELQRRLYKLADAGKPITANTLSEQKGDILASFWGDTMTIDEGARLTWMRQPHYYMGLYPYTYSAGLTISTAVAQMIKEEGQPAVNRWLEVLKTGGALKPLDLIKLAGADMSKPDAIRKAVAYVGSLVDELEQSF
jgi:oligoendopeptidase F